MTSAPPRTFLGLPVTGTTAPHHQTPQGTIQEFQPIFFAVFADTSIVEFGWTQIRHEEGWMAAWGTWVRTTHDIGADMSDLDLDCHRTLGTDDRFSLTTARCRDLQHAVERARFDEVLETAFGLDVRVTVTRSGITVQDANHRTT